MKYALLALALTACGITEHLEGALDNSPPEPGKVITIRRCAQDSAQVADTANYRWCESRPIPPGASL